MADRDWSPAGPLSISQTLGPHRRGFLDPTWRTEPDGSIWRALRTPEGPVSLRIQQQSDRIHGTAWGSGATWALDSLPRMLGADDDPHSFQPQHRVLRDLVGKFSGLRVGATGLLWDALLPAVIEQRVTSREAHRGFANLVRAHGEPAPGPASELGLWVPPESSRIKSIPSWDWRRFPVDHQRAGVVIALASSPGLLRVGRGSSSEEFDARIKKIPGIGVWTSAEVRSRAFGDADAVSFGDFHVARNIGFALTGAVVSDKALEDLLSPYPGHRYRVQRLVELAGLTPPRRGPRLSMPRHLPGM